jgi:hypothetical protein
MHKGPCIAGITLVGCVMLLQVKVASLAVSTTARSLAAVAEDGAVFFMLLGGHNNQKQQQQQQQFEPLVACQLGDVSPSCCCWSADGIKLLVGCGSGVAVEVTLPAPGTLDTSTCAGNRLAGGGGYYLNTCHREAEPFRRGRGRRFWARPDTSSCAWTWSSLTSCSAWQGRSGRTNTPWGGGHCSDIVVTHCACTPRGGGGDWTPASTHILLNFVCM